jgi:hypothetical protein
MKYFILIVFLITVSCTSKSWKDMSRESSGLAPRAQDLKEDIVQIYYARAYAWRGYFGVHPWISWKRVGESEYTVAQVTSWNLRRSGKSTVTVEKDLPDRLWFDNQPTILFEARGARASIIIEQIDKIISSYPYKDSYQVWPGPNSNTFVAYVIRNIKEFDIELPPHAIGKDYLGSTTFFSKTASNSGIQASAFGVLGLSIGLLEGLELNVLGLNFGVDFYTPALKLPLLGRVGFSDKGWGENLNEK